MWPAGTGLLAPVLVDSDTALFGLEGMLLWKHERFGFGLESLMGIRWSSYRCIADLADPTLDDVTCIAMRLVVTTYAPLLIIYTLHRNL